MYGHITIHVQVYLWLILPHCTPQIKAQVNQPKKLIKNKQTLPYIFLRIY